MRPSGDSSGETAESAKLVSCAYGGEPSRGPHEAREARRRIRFAALPHYATEIDHHLAHRLEPIRRILLERFFDDHPQMRRHRVRQRIRRTVNDCVQHVEVRCAGERPSPAEQFVQHDAEREHVASRVDGPSSCLLRRHVGCGADNRADLRLHDVRAKLTAGQIRVQGASPTVLIRLSPNGRLLPQLDGPLHPGDD